MNVKCIIFDGKLAEYNYELNENRKYKDFTIVLKHITWVNVHSYISSQITLPYSSNDWRMVWVWSEACWGVMSLCIVRFFVHHSSFSECNNTVVNTDLRSVTIFQMQNKTHYVITMFCVENMYVGLWSSPLTEVSAEVSDVGCGVTVIETPFACYRILYQHCFWSCYLRLNKKLHNVMLKFWSQGFQGL